MRSHCESTPGRRPFPDRARFQDENMPTSVCRPDASANKYAPVRFWYCLHKETPRTVIVSRCCQNSSLPSTRLTTASRQDCKKSQKDHTGKDAINIEGAFRLQNQIADAGLRAHIFADDGADRMPSRPRCADWKTTNWSRKANTRISTVVWSWRPACVR